MSSTLRPTTAAHCFRFPQLRALCKAPTTSFHHNFVLGILPHHHRTGRLQSEVDYPPHYRGPLFQISTTRGSMQSPNHQLLRQICFVEIYHSITELEGSKVSSTLRPTTEAHCFRFPQLRALCKAPTTSFHHTFVFSEFYHTITELEGSKVSLTIRPTTRAHFFTFSLLGALCKAPTTSFHHTIVMWNFTTPAQN